MSRLYDAIEPTLGELEPEYRQHFLKADVEQAIIGLRYILIPTILFAIGDYLLVGASAALLMLLAVRTVVLASSMVAIRYVRTVRRPAELDLALLIWSLIGIACVFAMNMIRPGSNTLQFGIQALTLLAVYLVLPNTLTARLGMAAFVTGMAFFMHLTIRREVELLITLQIWATVLLTNLMGIAISSRFFTLRREQFLSRLDLERTRDDLHAIATTDGLTGLLNRRRLLELGERELTRARRYQHELSVLALDLDHFKQINDRYGHPAGDAVLVAVAESLREQTRQHDLVGRIGGEELAIILPETSLESAERLAQRIRMRIRELRPVADGVAMSVTVSLGAVEALPDDDTIQDLLKRADRALYCAKERGRDCVVAADRSA